MIGAFEPQTPQGFDEKFCTCASSFCDNLLGYIEWDLGNHSNSDLPAHSIF
jgi:hypothetical protein